MSPNRAQKCFFFPFLLFKHNIFLLDEAAGFGFEQFYKWLACEQALLFGRVKRVSRQRASERRSREGPAKGELATIPYKFSFVLRPDEGKYHWLKNDVPEIKVD